MTNFFASLLIDLSGTELTAEEAELIQHPMVAGVILFARNYASKTQLTALCKSIRAKKTTPLLIAVDQEGGRVQRFKNDFTLLPSLSSLAKNTNNSAFIHDCAWLMAIELLSAGVDLSFAPVLDINKNKNSVISDRAFHHAADQVAVYAEAYVAGMHEAGMAATGKHFPGHGSVSHDTHTASAFDHRHLKEICNDDMQPFIHMLQHGIDAFMTAHITFTQVDNKPVSYSSVWLQDILRKQLKFRGIIFSDDLSMQGANISNNPVDKIVAAKEAGCDLLLLCNDRAAVIQTLDTLKPQQQASVIYKQLISRYHPLNYSDSPRWINTKLQLQGICHD